MISYTITVQKTQGTSSHLSSWSRAAAWDFPPPGYNGTDVKPFEGDPGNSAGGNSQTRFTQSDGGNSYEEIASSSFSESNEGATLSGSWNFYHSATEDSNRAQTWSMSYGGTFCYDGDCSNESDSYSEIRGLSATTISVLTSATYQDSVVALTTKTKSEAVYSGTTTILGTGSNTSVVATLSWGTIEATGTETTLIQKRLTIVSSTSVATQLATILTPPFSNPGTEFLEPIRDTAIVFQYIDQWLWAITATDLSSPGPFYLNDIATSYSTDVTVLPIYKTKIVSIIDVSDETFPESPETYSSFTYTGQSGINSSQTIYFPNISGFPLQSSQNNFYNYTTTTFTNTYESFSENNPKLTEEASTLSTYPSNSCQIVENDLSFQFFPETIVKTTKYVFYNTTSSSSYEGLDYEFDNGEKTRFFTNWNVSEADGNTKNEMVCERIRLRGFNPAKIFHRETSFSYAWGLHGSPDPEPKLAIETPATLSWRSWAELFPEVSVPYPMSSSWKSEASSITASIAGNFITVTTQSGTDANSASGSETYQFSGSGSANTAQKMGRDFVTNLQDLPNLSFFGPHAATGSVETRALPGTYVQISQDSLGDYTLNTITLQESSAATISQNAILYPAEQSFYTSTAGDLFLILPRNPIP